MGSSSTVKAKAEDSASKASSEKISTLPSARPSEAETSLTTQEGETSSDAERLAQNPQASSASADGKSGAADDSAGAVSLSSRTVPKGCARISRQEDRLAAHGEEVFVQSCQPYPLTNVCCLLVRRKASIFNVTGFGTPLSRKHAIKRGVRGSLPE